MIDLYTKLGSQLEKNVELKISMYEYVLSAPLPACLGNFSVEIFSINQF